MTPVLQRYVSRHSSLECAESYHVYAWLALVSACMGRRVWVDRGFFTTYPNLYVVLVGDAGSGKSVAMFQARDMIDELNNQIPKEERLFMAPKCSSARRLMEVIAAQQTVFKYKDKPYTHAPICCFLSELMNFIQLDPNFVLSFLTDGYDDKYFDYETQHKGCCRIDGPAPVILACTTHSYITSKLREDVVTDGFSRRVHWILDERSETRNAEPQRPPMDQELINRLKQIKKMIGPFTWSKEGKEAYDEWYNTNDRRDFGLDGYGTTKNVKIEKMAMLLAASERLEMVIRAEDVEESLELCKLMEKNLEKVFEGIGRNELNAAVSSLLYAISKSRGVMKENTARQFMYRQINSREFDEVVLHLVKSGRIEIFHGNNGAGKLLKAIKTQEDLDQIPKASKPHPIDSGHAVVRPPDDVSIQTGI